MIATAKQKLSPLAFVSIVALLALTACSQPPSDAVETAVTDSAEPAAVADDGQLASIDADGNIAPFGMASKLPVPVAKPEAVVVQEQLATVSTVYAANCAACHGADATGVEGLGLNLVESNLVAKSSAEELVVFITNGRQPDSPDSVTGVPMPAFAWMDAASLGEVAGYIKGLQK